MHITLISYPFVHSSLPSQWPLDSKYTWSDRGCYSNHVMVYLTAPFCHQVPAAGSTSPVPERGNGIHQTRSCLTLLIADR